MMIAKISIVTFLFAMATSAAAAEPATKPEAVHDPVVCHAEQPTGTRFEKRICMKKSEWSAQAESARANAHDTIDKPVANTATSN
jgi:hypothetical protein